MKKSLNLLSFFIVPFLSSSCPACANPAPAAAKNPQEPTVQNAIWFSPEFVSFLIKKGRYEAIEQAARHTPGYERMSDLEKEQLLLQIYYTKIKTILRSIALHKLFTSIIVLLFYIGLVGFSIFKPVFFLLKKVCEEVKQFFTKLYKKLKGEETVSGKKEEKDSLFTSCVMGSIYLSNKLMPSGMFSENDLKDIKTTLNNFSNQNFKTSAKFITLGILMLSIKMMQSPIVTIYKSLKNIWKLIQFIGKPYYDNPIQAPEELFVKSLYLFDDTQKMHMTTLLDSLKLVDASPLNEFYQFIAINRALPQGIQPVRYDQALIDEIFAHYTPEIKALAEQMIATIVLYTDTIKKGKEELMRHIPLKPILLLGPPGTGKSHFMKCIAKATGLSPVTINMAGSLEKEIKGEAGACIGKGHPSAYAKALLHAADEHGRNKKNVLLIFEEVDKFAGSPHVIDFLHRLLDPREQSTRDEYLHRDIPLPSFRYCTSNFEFKIPAIRDRFITYEMPGITPHNKEQIIKHSIVPTWVAVLAHPDLASELRALNPQACKASMEYKLIEYMRTHPEEFGMRGIEEEAWKIVSKLLVAMHKKAPKRKKSATNNPR